MKCSRNSKQNIFNFRFNFEDDMKVTIIGGGNMGGAIAQGLGAGSAVKPEDIVVINKSRSISYGDGIKAVVSDYSSLPSADIVIVAVKPWLVQDLIRSVQEELINPNQLFISVAAGITLEELSELLPHSKPIFRLMPNTAISEKKSMTFISSRNASEEQDRLVLNLFAELGKAELIDENLFSAATAMSGCGIAYALRYIRAAVQGGVEMGLSVKLSQKAVMQAMIGAVSLLENNESTPEDEIDKVTTPGGITIKGLNAMEEAGFSSTVIKGLKASNLK